MSKIYTSPLWSGALGVTKDITKFVQVSRVSEDLYEEAGLGGSADIFSGEYTKQDGGVTRVAIKCIRAFNLEQNADEQPERLQKKLLRELKIWRTLSGGANIIELIGIMNGIGPFPSFVCELCPWNLQDYLERKTPPPRHTKMVRLLALRYQSLIQLVKSGKMADTLRGLSYMHSLESGPVAHGDMKLTNILVTSDEHALICDFGRSRQPTDQPYEAILSNSSPFAGTVRYMSPELFVPNSARPSPAADMWAYGCVALEENISVDNDGRAKISLFSFGRMLAALPLDAGVTATVESVLSFRWMSPELITTNNPQPTTESDMWTFGCVCFWLLTLLPPYASTSRDDLAGMEIMQGHPPATLARVVIKAGYDFESTPMARDALHSNLPNEIAIMAQIDHPRIHKLLGIDSSIEPKQLPRMVFEPLSQATLESVLNQNLIDFESRMRILQDLASAITYLHSHDNGSIAHGNICPTNIYIFPDGSAKLTNFTCAFQYIISADPSPPHQWSEAIAMAEEPSLYRSPESRTVPGSELELVFPTLTGDVWSFGVVMLSSFSARFRIVDLENYSLALDAGDSPLELEGVGEECDVRMAGKSSSERRGTRSTSGAGPNLAPSNTSTQTSKSHKSRVAAASVLVTKTDMFEDWASVVKVQLAIETELPDTATFEVIKTLQARSLVFPKWLKQPSSKNWVMPPAYKKWQDKICSTLNGSTGQEYSFAEGRELDSGFPFAMSIIAQLCHHQERIRSNATRTGLTSKTDLRFLLDGLIMHGCDGDGDEFLIYSTDQKLKLPEIKPSEISEKVNVATTTADGVTSLDINDFKPYIRLVGHRAAMSPFSTKPPTFQLILVHCVVEYEREGTGENQMKMGIVSALYQKKVLGIQQQFAFGIFQYSGDGLQVVAGIWEGDIIKLYHIGDYSLRDPVSLIEFHLLLLAIKRLAAKYKQQLVDSSDALLNALKAKPPTHKWATPETRGTSTIPETPEEQDDPLQHGEGSSFQHGWAP
ncbi:Peptidyl-glycine alpha-amidating monooxygenase [Rhizoctonia solani]|uniref:Peptidyl-glycine alpha-amidating monooxygenase n=1 Tax=Rhizoctonia solani TaxID=456999 RepID=A0A0K6GEZ4_9AGAM|nr:Peptidyl-glycine alpha-amidating monooxygenase [Rhizoctonia solani]